MTSMFYHPAVEILRQHMGIDMGAGEITMAIREQYPELQWSGYQGPVRAMLLKASERATPIKRVPDSKPPKFYYDVEYDVEERSSSAPESTPLEDIDSAYAKINEELARKLKEQINVLDDSSFEELVNRVVGKALHGDHKTTPKNHDCGIDGFILQDNLGLNVVCVQAKHYTDHNVQRPEIDGFIGALEGRMGVFVTSSGYSEKAKEKAKHTPQVVLIDGKGLIELMIEYNVGVQDTERRFVIKRVDDDFFQWLQEE